METSFLSYHNNKSNNSNNITWDLAHWPILRRLKLDLLSLVSRFFVFSSGDSVLLLTTDNRILVFGDNRNGQLGLGHQDPVTQGPREWLTLRGVEIAEVRSGEHHLVLLTTTGNLVGLGLNASGQLARDPRLEEYIPTPTVIWRQVRMVAAGQWHSCVLDFDHRLWCMGHPCPDWTCHSPRLSPYQLPVSRADQIVSIHSTAHVLLGLTSTHHQLYLWIHDHRKPSFLYPLVVTTPTWITRQITPLANDRFLVLDTEGRVHRLWKTPLGSRLRARWFEFDEPIREITSHWTDSVAVMRSRSEALYLLSSGHQVTPLITGSPIDAFSLYSRYSNTPTLVSIPFSSARTLEKLNHFNDPSTADFTVYVHFKPLHLHRSVMFKRIRNWAHLASHNDSRLDLYLPEPEWYAVYYTYLLYLYTARFEPERHWAPLLYHLAIVNRHPNLCCLCRDFILQNTTPRQLASDYARYRRSTLEHFDLLFASLVTVDNCLLLYEKVFELSPADSPLTRHQCAQTFYRNFEWIIASPFYQEMNPEAAFALVQEAKDFDPLVICCESSPNDDFEDYGLEYDLSSYSSSSTSISEDAII